LSEQQGVVSCVRRGDARWRGGVVWCGERRRLVSGENDNGRWRERGNNGRSMMQGCLRSGLLQLSCCNTGLCVLQAYTTAHCAVVQLRRAGDRMVVSCQRVGRLGPRLLCLQIDAAFAGKARSGNTRENLPVIYLPSTLHSSFHTLVKTLPKNLCHAHHNTVELSEANG
jgi:hypothetical protein